MAAGSESSESRGENLALTGSLASEVRGQEALLDLWVSAESSGAAAGNVAEDEVEQAFCFRELGGVGFEGADAGGLGEEAGRERLEAARIGVGGQELGCGVAAGENEGLTSGSGTAVPDAGRGGVAGGGQLGDQARAVVDVGEGDGEIVCGFLRDEERSLLGLVLVVSADGHGGGATVGPDPAGY